MAWSLDRMGSWLVGVYDGGHEILIEFAGGWSLNVPVNVVFVGTGRVMVFFWDVLV